MKALILFLLIFICPLNSYTQGWHNVNNGARSMGIGNAAVALQGIDAAFSNQAGLAFIKSPTAIIYGENRFSQSALFEFSGAFVSPVKNLGQIGISLHYFGEEQYNIQHLGLSYSKLLFRRLAIAGQLDLLNTRIPQYGSRFGLTAEIGILAEIFDNFHLGFHSYSPVAVEFIPEETIPTVFNLGISYKLSKFVQMFTAVEKNMTLPIAYKFGLEYLIQDKIKLRGGYQTEPAQWSFGIGYQILENLRIDAGGNYHTELGYSPGISIIFGDLVEPAFRPRI